MVKKRTATKHRAENPAESVSSDWRADMDNYLRKKLSGEVPIAEGGAKLTRARIATAREHLRREAALKRIDLEERISLFKKFPLPYFLDRLPNRTRNSRAVLDLIRHKNTDTCLAAIDKLSQYLRRNYHAGPLKRKSVVIVLEKILLSNVQDEVKKKVVKTLLTRGIEESNFVLKWVSAQTDMFSAEVREQAAEAAKKLHARTIR